MANSKYEYVKQFEQQQILLLNTYIVVRIDGKGFHKFTKHYDFEKPNDKKGLSLMNLSAQIVMETFPDIQIAYGQSDEYSFVLNKDTTLYNRRSDKIATCICSTFTAVYTHNFQQYMGKPLQMPYLPVFDSRCICYPDIQNIRDYLSWRQVDCHINNLYNTCFWGLVGQGINKQEAENILSKTNAGEKNELLFSKLGKNYNNEDEQFKKGSTLIRQPIIDNIDQGIKKLQINLEDNEIQKLSRKQRKKLKYEKQVKQEQVEKKELEVQIFNLDIIKDEFWFLNKQYILL